MVILRRSAAVLTAAVLAMSCAGTAQASEKGTGAQPAPPPQTQVVGNVQNAQGAAGNQGAAANQGAAPGGRNAAQIDAILADADQDYMPFDWGTVPYYLSDDGDLYLGTGELSEDSPFGPPFNRKEVKHIHVRGTVKLPKDSTGLFADFVNLESVTVDKAGSGWDTSEVEILASLFANCTSLWDISGLADWDVQRVDCMDSMFSHCVKLKNINALATWDTLMPAGGGARTMNNVFYWCESLASVTPLASWDTSKVTTVRGMFAGCKSLRNLNGLQYWDTSFMVEQYAFIDHCSPALDHGAIADWILFRSGSES